MKLSEAILLGDPLKESNAGTFIYRAVDGAYCGCALGGALLAAGKGEQIDYMGLNFMSLLYAEWPWLKNKLVYSEYGPFPVAVSTVVSYMYFRVAEGKMTLEQIADWVRSVEPKEEETENGADREHQEVHSVALHG